MMNRVVVIPALNPGIELIALVSELIKLSCFNIVVVNDGSHPDHQNIFTELATFEDTVVLSHEENLGKGAALKTAFNYCYKHFSEAQGVVTADCDGQHSPADILGISDTLAENQDSLILGARNFSGLDIPKRSLMGNRFTSKVYKFFYKVDLADTQTGLRGIPLKFLDWMKTMEGDHYEYEINMLINAKYRKIPIINHPIQVIYFNNNQGSHYKTVRDSVRIGKIMYGNLSHPMRKPAKSYGKLFGFCRKLLRLYTHELTVVGEVPKGPVVYVGHHQNLKGVLRVLAWFNQPTRLWMLKDFCDKEACFNQYYDYTFTTRMGWPKLPARILAGILSHIVPGIAKSLHAIPVYRNSIKDLKKTVQLSLSALENEENLLIFPDIDYASNEDQVGELYKGFVGLDALYFTKHKEHLKFVPLRVDRHLGELVIGEPISILEGENRRIGKERVVREIQEELNRIEPSLEQIEEEATYPSGDLY